VPAVELGFLSLPGAVAWVIAFAVTGYEGDSAWPSVSHYVTLGGYVVVVLPARADGSGRFRAVVPPDQR
jgi:hypothetical protein